MNWLGQGCLMTAGAMTAVLLYRLSRGAVHTFLGAHRKMAEHDLAALFVVTSGARIAWLTAALAVTATGHLSSKRRPAMTNFCRMPFVRDCSHRLIPIAELQSSPVPCVLPACCGRAGLHPLWTSAEPSHPLE